MTEENTFSYKIKTETFEGPLDLLLSLIESRKLFVNEISLSEVTSDYIAYIKQIENTDANERISNISYFIVIAATLILIKSKSLLPNLDLTDEETGKIEDLEKRLQIYKIIKDISLDIKNQFGVNIIYPAPERKYNDPVFSPDPQITISNIFESINNVIQNIPKEKEVLPEIEVKKVISIDEMIGNLTERIQSSLNTSFREFSKVGNDMNEKEVRVTIIVSFLAMLELVREGIIEVIQNNNFEDITMSKLEENQITENNG